MKLARSSFYSSQKPSKVENREQELVQTIRKIQTEHFYTIGRRRMGTLVQRYAGCSVGESRLQRLMSKYGLRAKIRQIRQCKPCSSRVRREGLPGNILNRDFCAQEPEKKFLTDVTYIPYFENNQWHWGYLSLVLDMFDRSVVSWVYSRTQDNYLALNTLRILSYKHRTKDAVLHSDHGNIYTSNVFREMMRRLGIQHSLSRVGNCHDNAPMECFNGTLKVEGIYNELLKQEKPSFIEQNRAIAIYLDYYNNRRPSSVLGNLSPAQYREKFLKQSTACN